ncbi:capsular exopolysaccharide family protein [Sphingomonas sp. LH128]|uniref:GumC family protein n=1 Tax=Sphingomonas sp. LH128 TaxID=473781 RepID=UPI00027CA2E1|nr:polysaccharide biosynthesis tyrosine autokinase [Sphingomonas sp. LH128]EJU14687.1 capsular exopolysaccharide family protein [Sphingomonas sp. LH128]
MQNVGFDRDIVEDYPEDHGDGLDFAAVFKTVLRAVRRNIALISAILVGMIIAGFALTLLITPKYMANAQVLIEDQADQIIEGSELQKVGASWDTDRFLQTQLGIIKSRSLARIVIQSGGFDKKPEFFEALDADFPEGQDVKGRQLAQVRQEAAVNVLVDHLKVDLPPDSRIATITVTSRDATLAAKLANVYADRYVEYNLNQKYGSSAYARRFLGDQLSEARAKLTQSERDLNQYARAAGLIRVTSQGESGTQEAALSVTNSTLMQLNEAASKAVADRITAEDRWNTLARQPALSVPEVNSNSAIQQLIGEKTRIEGELAEEQSRHLEGYATVKSKRAQISELDRRISMLAETLKKTAFIDYQASLERERSLTGQVNNLRNEALGEQDRGVQYSVLKRVADTNRALYETLLSRYNQISATAGASNNNITIVDRAEVPRVPASPKLLINLAVAFILGLIFAAAAVFVREIFDDAIRTPDDVEGKLNMRLLGLIPMLKADEDVDEKIADRRSSVSEAYRSLVTNLQYSTVSGLPQILCITSSREGEGKSTTARTIARDIASLGKKVLLVDMDLRRPTLHRTMGLGKTSGLTDLLTGNKTFDQVLIHSGIENLDCISGLPTPPDPALILSGEGIPAFFSQARERYDVVVVDSAPLLGLSDAVVLAGQADGVLFVIDGSGFHRGAVKSALRRLALINANILGVVLNRFEPRVGDTDYKYYAYNYYSYGSKEE